MKRTTYIFIGVFTANVILAVILMVYLKGIMMNSEDINYRFNFEQQQSKSLDLEDIHTIEFITKGADADQFYFATPGKIEVTTAAATGKKIVSYPTSDYLKVNKEEGVLKVILDLSAENLKEDNSGIGKGIFLNDLLIKIQTDKILKKISSDKGFNISMHQINLDSLTLASKSAHIDACKIQSLILHSNMSFNADGSSFNDLYLDMDETHWNIKGSNINTLYLTGSKKHKNNLSADQYHKLVWKPKTENAELNLNLKTGAEVIVNN